MLICGLSYPLIRFVTAEYSEVRSFRGEQPGDKKASRLLSPI